jgi:hypothetical protein
MTLSSLALQTGKSLLWDESADSLIVTGTTTLVGTTNLDAVDIDGATQIDATVTVGVDDTGYDVKFFGATAGAYMLWDESADDLILGGAAGLSVNSTALVTGVLTTTAATVSNGGGQFNGAINVGVDDTGYDVKFFGATAGKYMLWDESADTLEVSGTVVAAAGTALLPSITTTGDLNTGMWFPAADTIAFSEGGVEALRIDSSGNVGIGAPPESINGYPSRALQIQGTGSHGVSVTSYSAAAAPTLDLNTFTSTADASGRIYFFKSASDTKNTLLDVVDGSSLGQMVFLGVSRTNASYNNAAGIQAVVNGTASTYVPADLTLWANSGATSRINAPNLTIRTDGGITVDGGVYLGGTGAANHLDDYEEGTWVPTLPNGGTSLLLYMLTTITIRYIKIGNVVTI